MNNEQSPPPPHNPHPPNPTTITTTTTTTTSTSYDSEIDSTCSTPFVSAPSSPSHTTTTTTIGFFYSAPTSPMHYITTTTPTSPTSTTPTTSSFEFEFSSRFPSPTRDLSPPTLMSTADELFLNGQIRPVTLHHHRQHPQPLPPFHHENSTAANDAIFLRSSRLRNRSQCRRTRSLSPLRTTSPYDWLYSDEIPTKSPPETSDQKETTSIKETTPSSGSETSSRCSSAGRSSKRWVFLKDFLRSKSEGSSSNNNHKFWHNISLISPGKEKKGVKESPAATGKKIPVTGGKQTSPATGKRRSAHEVHYTMNRAQAEEMRKKTFLPYRPGLLGCLGFNSKSYGALNGFARALNPVSST